MSDPRRTFLILLLLNTLWAPVNLMVKLASGEMSVLAVAAIRWVLFALLLVWLIQFQGFRQRTRTRLPSPRDAALALLLGALLNAPAHLCYYTGIQSTTTVEGTVLGVTFPLWVALLSIVLLKERIDARRWTAIGLGIVGVYVVSVGWGLPAFSSSGTRGNLLYLLGVLLESVSTVVATQVVRRSSGMGALTWQTGGTALGFAAAGAAIPGTFSFVVPGPAAIFAILYLTLVAGLICWGSWFVMVERAPISMMVVAIGVQAPVAGVLGNWVLHEPITVRLIVGAMVVLAALAIGVASGRGTQMEGIAGRQSK